MFGAIVLTVTLGALWLVAFGGGAVLLWRGFRGRLIDNEPRCRRCRYNVGRRRHRPARCPECGANLQRLGSIRLGLRRWHAPHVAWGVLLTMIALSPFGILAWRAMPAPATLAVLPAPAPAPVVTTPLSRSAQAGRRVERKARARERAARRTTMLEPRHEPDIADAFARRIEAVLAAANDVSPEDAGPPSSLANTTGKRIYRFLRDSHVVGAVSMPLRISQTDLDRMGLPELDLSDVYPVITGEDDRGEDALEEAILAVSRIRTRPDPVPAPIVPFGAPSLTSTFVTPGMSAGGGIRSPAVGGGISLIAPLRRGTNPLVNPGVPGSAPIGRGLPPMAPTGPIAPTRIGP